MIFVINRIADSTLFINGTICPFEVATRIEGIPPDPNRIEVRTTIVDQFYDYQDGDIEEGETYHVNRLEGGTKILFTPVNRTVVSYTLA